VHSLQTRRSFPVSTGFYDDREPRWDPAGKYLYFLSARTFNPLMSTYDMGAIFSGRSQVYAIPLAASTPPPLPELARAAGLDLEAWSRPGHEQRSNGGANGEEAPQVEDDGDDEAQAPAPMRIDTDGLTSRHYPLPIEPGHYAELEALRGGIAFIRTPLEGLLDDQWIRGALGPGTGTLHRYDIVEDELSEIAGSVDSYVISADRSTLAWPSTGSVIVQPIQPPGEVKTLSLADAKLRIDARAEWRQMLDEAWRLQRDFYWAPNMAGVDWEAMKHKYEALLPRIGTREELNDLIRRMINELGTSHTYIWGGELHEREEPDAVSIGLLGADVIFDGAFRIERIVPGSSWDPSLHSPLEAAHLNVSEGDVLWAINGRRLEPGMNVYELLQDEAGKLVTLTIAGNADGANRRDVDVRTLPSERELRYQAWVADNRQRVAEASNGRLGYLHLPDMGGPGLSMFGRQWFAQSRKPAIVVDIRDNGGGFVSQIIIERLNRDVLAFGEQRHGPTTRYPMRAPHAHMVGLIDQFAGSDGDIFPAMFRATELGPLIGTRTWGGVVGIRGDKPFLDYGLTTQPEFAFRDFRGWSLENVGVEPDIEVPITPADRLADRDPQLERAIGWLLQQLEQDPMELPAAPPYPNRGME
jgi:tricorn protease